jgi:ribose/xylose/arabinose/galactoside ABC-type transport system permease subunit
MAEVAKKQKPFSVTAKDITRRIFKYENTMLVIILVAIMAALGVMTKGLTLTIHNMSNVWTQSATRGIVTIGQLFCLLSAGLDLSVGGVALMVTILGASLMTHQTHISVAAVGTMLAVGIGIGALNGGLISRIGMSPVIVTLAMW